MALVGESISRMPGPPFGRIDLAVDALEADLVINLAKLKTHVMMRLTLGVTPATKLPAAWAIVLDGDTLVLERGADFPTLPLLV